MLRLLYGTGVLYLLLLAVAPMAVAQDAAPAELAAAVQQAIDKVKPALIRIQVVEAAYYSGREQKVETSGSGVIISEDGYAVTNHHVAGNARLITVTLSSKEEVDAELVGTDAMSDIAVIKLQGQPGRKFPVAEWGSSSALSVGETVLAMGSPWALSQSVTVGVVSNLEMVMPDFMWPYNSLELDGEDVGSMVRWIGHDALIRGGNSGGPLVNLQGRVIGINEIEFGLSGAIPGDLARQVAEQIIREGEVTRSWLGLDTQPMLQSLNRDDGALVASVIANSPADEAGVKSGDIILEVNGEPVSVQFAEEVPLFNQLVAELPVGQPVTLSIVRDGKEMTLSPVTLEREEAYPREREFSNWGLTGHNISYLMAREMDRANQDGVEITGVSSGGPASNAKPPLESEDILLKVGDTDIRNVQDLEKVTEDLLDGREGRVPVLVEFERRTERLLTVVSVGKDPLQDPGLEAAKAWIPVGTQVLTGDVAEALGVPGNEGVRVTEVYKNHSAEKAGLRVGDIITELDGEPIEASQPQDMELFPAMVRQKVIGEKAELTVLRDGEPVQVTVDLEPSPKLPREMKRYRSDLFEFTVRNITFTDQQRTESQQKAPVKGVAVESVVEGGWAALARLGVGDIITSVNGTPVTTVAELGDVMEEIEEEQPESVVFHVRRGIRQLFVEVRPNWEPADG